MRALAMLNILWIIASMAVAAWGIGFKIALDTESGVTVLDADDFSMFQRTMLILLASATNYCWLWILAQVVLMSYEFSAGKLLSKGIVRALRRFAIGLFALAIAELFAPFIVNGYLQWLGKCDPLNSSMLMYLGEGTFQSLMAGSLVMILSMIVEQGMQLREEADLTV